MCLLQRLYLIQPPLLVFSSVNTEDGHRPTIFMLKYIYVYLNSAFLQKNKNTGKEYTV